MVACTDKDDILKRTTIGFTAQDEKVSLSQLTIGQQTPAASREVRRQSVAPRSISTEYATDDHMSGIVNDPAANSIHVPVMPTEVVDALSVADRGAYVDCNVAEGGHAEEVLRAARGVSLLGVDLDETALKSARHRLAEYSDRLELVQSNFSQISQIAGGRLFDGVLFDLGVSSLQLDTPERGFSFRGEAPLDMRFDPGTGLTADDIVNRYPERELEAVIRQYGEEPRSRSIAKAIVHRRRIATTTQLADVVKRAVAWSSRSRVHPATRTFQALRIAVNGELDNLERGLMGAIEVLRPKGRLVVISYHSLEDRVVKNVVRREASSCVCPPGLPVCVCRHNPTLRRISRRVITPAEEEIRSNPRARSAKLRIAQRR